MSAGQKGNVQIYLIRHGEAGKAWHEDPNPGLSKEGRNQAETTCNQLIREWSAQSPQLLTSPLLRARETADIFKDRLGGELINVHAFSEIPSPGVPLAERPGWLQSVFKQSVGELEEGLVIWRNQIIETIENIDCHTLIFSHFMVINCVVGWLEGHKKLVSFKPGYCSITHIERNPTGMALKMKGMDAESLVR